MTLVRLRAYWRFLIVSYQFLPLVIAYARDRRRFLLFGRSRTVAPEQRVARAELLLTSLLTLGPTFIKLGQLLSTRPDVLPTEYIDVLTRLQDDVPPADWTETKAVLEEELGPVEEVFDQFDTDPISGASLGQVHVAEHNGDQVAVKVRRPGVEELVEADLRAIQWFLPLIRRFIDDSRAYSLDNLSEEFSATIRQEMDYERELGMLTEIRDNFADYDGIQIPNAIKPLSGPRVLTMEYRAGAKISDIEELDRLGIDRTALAERLQRIYLQMIIDDGVFHADPHPGNLAVDDDGTIIFYDFGMSGRVDSRTQETIIDFYIAVAEQDTDAILDALIEMGTLSPDADREVMGNVMQLAIADARGEDIEQYRVQEIIDQIESTMYEFPLRLPRNLALVLRVATVVEGVCVTLDEDFDFITVATEYLTEQGFREESVRRILSDVADQTQATAESLFQVPPKLETSLDRLNRDDLTVNVHVEDEHSVFDQLAARLLYSLLLAVGALSTAILYAFDGPVPAAVAAALTLPVLVLLYRSFRSKRGGISAQPQFTRQNLRQRRQE